VRATVAKVARPDWLRNAAGLASPTYWQGTLTPRPTVDWYLTRIEDAIAAAKADGASKVTLVAHSAGGWLARVYLHDFGVDDVRALVSLGSPLNACPKDVPGVVDQTRGAFYLTLVPIRPRWRGERRSLRTFPGASLRPGSLAFDPDTPRRLSTPPDAFQLHP